MSLRRSKAVLELGRKLVAQLASDDDLLASWMAHYVAERIEDAESSSGAAKLKAQDSAAAAILELWRHRSALPSHLRPLAELERIQRTLAALDVDRTDYRYHPEALREAATADAEEDTKRWIELAIGLDYSARLLVRYALRSAADRAASQSEPWVELARRAGADEGAERGIIVFVRGSDEDVEADTRREQSALLDQVKRLEGFAQLASAIAKELRAGSSYPQRSPKLRGAKVKPPRKKK